MKIGNCTCGYELIIESKMILCNSYKEKIICPKCRVFVGEYEIQGAKPSNSIQEELNKYYEKI